MKREHLDEMLRDAQSADSRRAFRRSADAVARWEREHPVDLAAILIWIDDLRALFGDPPVDRTPWQVTDVRL
jgi:hypothetical protein